MVSTAIFSSPMHWDRDKRRTGQTESEPHPGQTL